MTETELNYEGGGKTQRDKGKGKDRGRNGKGGREGGREEEIGEREIEETQTRLAMSPDCHGVKLSVPKSGHARSKV